MADGISVALCDSEKKELDMTGLMIKEWFAASGLDNAEVKVYGDAAAFRSRFSEGDLSDIYVFGIAAHGAPVLELTRMVRAKQPSAPVIFTARTGTHAADAYSLHVLRYVPKPVKYEELASALDLAHLIHRTSPNSTVTVRNTGFVKTVKTDDVIFVENNVRSMRYVLRDGSVLNGIRRNVSFEKFFAPLLSSGEFVQPHKSFIVNIRHIRAMKSAALVMSNGAQIPISRRHLSEVHEAYENYSAF